MKDIYSILITPDPILKQTASPVAQVDQAVQAQMDRMLATMYDARGIGLAANQVGLLNRVLVLDVPEGCWEYGEEKDGILQIHSIYRSGKGENLEEQSDDEVPEQRARKPMMIANPEVIWQSEQCSVFEEGCLSIPGQYAEVERPAKVRVKYLDYQGKEQEVEAEGLFSHCLQHEIDHLNGRLFTDYLSSLKRNMILRRVDKMKKQNIL